MSNSGEQVRLRNASNAIVNAVTYGVGFPWPTAAHGEGSSIELINPALDNTVPGSWRSSTVVSSGVSATPGAINSAYVAQAPPAIDQVVNSPVQPTSGQPVTITAHVVAATGTVNTVVLSYQIVNPGSYIRKTDPSYATSWTTAPMVDDGTNGDGVAGDSIYTAVLPGSLQVHRRLIRYRITATDSSGDSVQVPYADDGSPNFAYFTYDGYPSWTGALVPGTTSATTYTPSLLQSLPTYQLLANSADVAKSQYNSSYNQVPFFGTLIYNNKVYDHIQYNNRGQASTYVSGKNKWRFNFNTAHEFQAYDNWGRPYPETWNNMIVNANASPWIPANRDMAGLDEAVSFRFQELVTGFAPKTHYFHFRVIDQAAENPTNGSQYTGGNPSTVDGGDLWGLYLAVETPDGAFLDARGAADGNTYEIENFLGNQKHQGATEVTDGSDWTSFLNASGETQTEAWWRANMDLPAYYSFQASNRALGNVDLRAGNNHCFYHNPDGLWTVIPWDLDLMYVPKTHNSEHITQNSCLGISAINTEYKDRCRELLDLILDDPSVNGGQVGQLVDEYAQMINPTGATQTWARLDAAMWNENPRTTGGHYGNFFETPITDTVTGGSWVRTLVSPDIPGFVQYITDYMTNTFPSGPAWQVNNGNQMGYGYQYVLSESADSSVPNRPTAAYTGASGYPLNNLAFTSSTYSSPLGATSFAAIQWRVGEISAPGIPLYDPTKPRIYEITDVWRSDPITSASGATLIPGTNLTAGHTYRVRLRHEDTGGRWSRWSPAIQFVAGAASSPYQSLEVTEIMYNPGNATSTETAAGFSTQDFEYIKLLNAGAVTLDMSVVSFTSGISYTFPAGATLAPGASVVVVKNLGAFALRYGSSIPVLGPYSKNLSNSGDTITLTQGGSSTILSFAYSDGSHPATGQTTDPWPTAPDGNGYSLVLIAPETLPDPSIAANWRASRVSGGSPGAPDTVDYGYWALSYPGVGASSATVGGDLYDNLVAYALNANPFDPSPSRQPAQSTQQFTVNSVPGSYLTYTFVAQGAATDITYHVEFSTDLINWTESGTEVSATANPDGTATEIWRAADLVDKNSAQFVRLRISQP